MYCLNGESTCNCIMCTVHSLIGIFGMDWNPGSIGDIALSVWMYSMFRIFSAPAFWLFYFGRVSALVTLDKGQRLLCLQKRLNCLFWNLINSYRTTALLTIILQPYRSLSFPENIRERRSITLSKIPSVCEESKKSRRHLGREVEFDNHGDPKFSDG